MFRSELAEFEFSPSASKKGGTRISLSFLHFRFRTYSRTVGVFWLQTADYSNDSFYPLFIKLSSALHFPNFLPQIVDYFTAFATQFSGLE